MKLDCGHDKSDLVPINGGGYHACGRCLDPKNPKWLTPTTKILRDAIRKIKDEYHARVEEAWEVEGEEHPGEWFIDQLEALCQQHLEREVTPDGFKIVYISDFSFDCLEKAMDAVAHQPMNKSPYPVTLLRDGPGKIEFRRLSKPIKGERK